MCFGLLVKVTLTLSVQKFTNSLPSYSPLFTSETSIAELERTIAIHFLRTGQFATAETFLQVCPFHLLGITFVVRVIKQTRNLESTFLQN